MNDQLPIPFPRGEGGRVFVERSGGGGWPDGLSWVIFAVLLVLLLLAIVSLALDYYYRSRPSAAVTTRSDALAELDLRYARGEIGRDEYLQRRVDLGGSVVPVPPADATTVVGPPQPQT
jgi:putative membrane protein